MQMRENVTCEGVLFTVNIHPQMRHAFLQDALPFPSHSILSGATKPVVIGNSTGDTATKKNV